jgi:putative DNA-invertase from lambdoid prophage Rac
MYCRVSTDDQCCERQERDLKAFARRSGHKIVAVFKETASGADDLHGSKVSVLAQNGLSFDLSTSTGKLMRTIMAGLAEFERT